MVGCNYIITQVPNLIVGCCASLLATGFLFLKNWRSEQTQCLLMMRAEIWEIGTHIDYSHDYTLVLRAFERMHELMLRVYQLDAPLMWLMHRKERKLVHSILAEIDHVCNLARDCNIGERNEVEEYASRLRRIKQEIGFDDDHNMLYLEYEINLMLEIMSGWFGSSLCNALSHMSKNVSQSVESLLLSGKIPGPNTNRVLPFVLFKKGEKKRWLLRVFGRSATNKRGVSMHDDA